VSEVPTALSAQPSAQVTEPDPQAGVGPRKKAGAAAVTTSTVRADESRQTARQGDDAPRATRAGTRSAAN
jgi:hypothetical protein